MPVYQSGPAPYFGPGPAMLLQGQAGYSFGVFSDHNPTIKFIVNNSADTAGTYVLTGQVWEGPNPAAPMLITTQGLTNVANVTNAAISSVSLTSQTGPLSGSTVGGTGTITFSSGSSTAASAADHGIALITPYETPDVISAATKGAAFAIQATNVGSSSYGITWAYEWISAPVSCSIQLEGAVNDVDSEYTIIGSAQTVVTASTWTETFATVPTLCNFVRLHITAVSGGTNPSIVGKIINS